MAASFSSFEPRPNRVLTPRMKNTWNGAIREGVRARSRTSARSVSERSKSNRLKSRRSAGTRCFSRASRQRLRKKTSSPTNTYTGRSLRASTSETKRSACAKARIRNPPFSETLQHIADQGARKRVRQPFQRGGVFLKETGEFLRDLILLAEQVRGVFVEHLALAVGQRHFRGDDDKSARRPPGLRVIGQR